MRICTKHSLHISKIEEYIYILGQTKLLRIDFVVVLARLRLLHVVHVGHPGSIVPDKRQLSSLHGRTDAHINESVNFMSPTLAPIAVKD